MPKNKHKNTALMREQFLEMMISLLENGFSLQESLAVMQRNRQFSPEILQCFTSGLAKGGTFAECFYQAGFTLQEMTQVQLADVHGNVVTTLKNILNTMQILRKQKKELSKIATYPALLFIFVITLLFAMRFFLLPSLLQSGMIDTSHWSILLITYGPFIMVGMIVVIGCLFGGGWWYSRQQPVIWRAVFFANLPLVGFLYKMFQTSYFALEWGKMFKQGLEARQILAFMATVNPHSLVASLAKELNNALSQGKSLAEELEHYTFLLPEFSLIILQGEVKGKLGEELLLYSQLLTKRIVEKVEGWIQWVQPVVFLVVAVLIMAIYIAMFLPMYENIGGIME
ncbi:competence type IV pilus assembly protein ComGB [Tetragenococcus koreensis]|uniref:competence type IV pilus assembly protein ComGB n=1 Tax=Tetragenococcus koreensis TaxID=290335 RepID=UPI001F1C695C|nr:competence type IV pilus assembly protein ComGB [Tetragenococcus koreensis]MCF1618041.1 type II secretion system F family protein [Tetragenococcus koreensis]MCF1622887.1 type II secretion system F family protein [Tetragenococcus koreensis]MCF1627160.1 type II secretion system F family protein [Tetragenococcus koreensis]MCF1678865.1 type II secretion system F family protein [Tetragenococcus koreensis]MCF1681312.1 type II secretion system F family protein [Tetragenococcus koreensis]